MYSNWSKYLYHTFGSCNFLFTWIFQFNSFFCLYLYSLLKYLYFNLFFSYSWIDLFPWILFIFNYWSNSRCLYSLPWRCFCINLFYHNNKLLCFNLCIWLLSFFSNINFMYGLYGWSFHMYWSHNWISYCSITWILSFIRKRLCLPT